MVDERRFVEKRFASDLRPFFDCDVVDTLGYELSESTLEFGFFKSKIPDPGGIKVILDGHGSRMQQLYLIEVESFIFEIYIYTYLEYIYANKEES